MVGDSKILTVSYGTFSCTLEGFDEPFSTMKAIAEYFRDLAADDRYFGAEPPTPDTEMLHKIAESTIQRRVAAELAENGVILRQTEAAPQVAAQAPALAVEMPKADRREQQSPAPKADVMSSVSDVPVSPQQTPIRAIVAPPVAAPEHGGGDTVAEKLQRIRAVVARENAAPAPYSEDQHAVEFSAAGYEDLEDDAPSALFDAPIETGFETEDDDALDAVMSGLTDTDSDAAEGVAGEEVFEDPEIDEAESEVEAEGLEAEVDIDVATEEAEASDEVEAEVEPEEVEAEAEEDTGAEVEVEAEATDEVEAESETAQAAELDATDDDDAVDEDTEAEAIHGALAEDEDTDVADEDDSSLRIKPRRRIVVQKISRADMEAAQAAKEAELPPEMEAELMAELAEVEAETTTEDVSFVEEAVAEAAIEDEPQDDDADDILSRLSDSVDDPILDTEDDAVLPTIIDDDYGSEDVLNSLMGDPNEVEFEFDAKVVDETEAKDLTDEDAPKRKSFAAMAEDDAIERLMSTTGSRLENDESSVRRASIAHLKAAVAATKADSSIVEAADKREEEELDQYRDDLARVVRPSRPVASSSRSDRPSPLVLVSAQRIDHPQEAPDALAASAAGIDVRPRRVTHGNLALQEEMEEDFDTEENLFNEETQITFAEYAAKAGALELPDLLEAAAAHYVEIEGVEHFTRAMLMRKLAQISGPEAPSREDGLRAFGTLLRTGKIVKTDNGKFTLSKSSQFA